MIYIVYCIPMFLLIMAIIKHDNYILICALFSVLFADASVPSYYVVLVKSTTRTMIFQVRRGADRPSPPHLL